MLPRLAARRPHLRLAGARAAAAVVHSGAGLSNHARPAWLASPACPLAKQLPLAAVRCLTTEVPGAKAEVARIMKAFEEARDSCLSGTFEPTLGDDGVLWLNLGEKGYYSLQESGQQLLLFSPVTGALSSSLSNSRRACNAT